MQQLLERFFGIGPGSGMSFEDAVHYMTKAPKTKLKGFWG